MHGRKICQWNSSTTSRQEAQLASWRSWRIWHMSRRACHAVSIAFEHAKHSRVLRLCSGRGMLSAEAEWLKAEGTQGALKGHWRGMMWPLRHSDKLWGTCSIAQVSHCFTSFHNVSASVVAYHSFVFFSALSLQFLKFAANRLQRLGWLRGASPSPALLRRTPLQYQVSLTSLCSSWHFVTLRGCDWCDFWWFSSSAHSSKHWLSHQRWKMAVPEVRPSPLMRWKLVENI